MCLSCDCSGFDSCFSVLRETTSWQGGNGENTSRQGGNGENRKVEGVTEIVRNSIG